MDVAFGIPLWIILLGIVAILLYWYGNQPFQIWKNLGVTGPAPHMFLGNIPEMFNGRVGCRGAIKQWQKVYGRLFGVYFFRVPTLFVTDPDVLKQIFVSDFNNFADRFLVGNGKLQQRIIKKGLFFVDGADWKRIRRIMSPTFSSGKLKLVTHHINLTAQRLAENLKELADSGVPVEAKKVFGAFTLDVICGTAFGLDTNSQQNFEEPFIQHARSLTTFNKTLQIMMSVTGAFPLVADLFKILEMGFFKKSDVKFFEKNIVALIQERKAHPEKQKTMDFLQLLLDAEAEDSDELVGKKKLTTEEIAAQSLLFIIAGYETTSTTLQYLSYELAKSPEIQARMRQEIAELLGNSTEPDYDKCQHLKYTEAVINETLRIYPPVHLLTRLADNAIDIKGVQIPKKTPIMIPLGNIGKDPEFYEDPDTFNPERFLNENKSAINPVTFLPFGYGPRICIGMRLAMIELKIALVHILTSVEFVGVSPKELVIEDYSGALIPKIPIQLHVHKVQK